MRPVSAFRCVLLCALLVLPACEGKELGAREKGALGGAAVGAGLGAIIGHQTGSTGAGIAIGSAFGALSGGLIGNSIDKADAASKETEARLAAQDKMLAENQQLINELRQRGADVRSTERGVVINLPDVLFQFDSARLTPDARRVARDVANAIKATPGRHIAIEGHTDSIGTIEYNQKLSEARARAVASELVTDGVARSRITARGYGESRPIASNKTESGRQRNRRVEVVIENR
ncbi:MAG: OmpA family protein [Deltaproteobacteria bacterium]|nr:OmpA family protein [Deltaproteobacteria bacterium]